MKYIIFFFLFFLKNVVPSHAAVSDLILKSKAGTTLGKTALYADSSFARPATIPLPAGELVEVLGQTRKEYDDKDQHQKFRWYQIRTSTGLTGWVFGDALAVLLSETKLEKNIRFLHKRVYKFNNGFDNSIAWFAAVEGHDNLGGKEWLNPVYAEYYFVLTNEKGVSELVNYGGQSTTAKANVKSITVQDLTGDGIGEVILQRCTTPVGANLEDRNLEIYSFQPSGLGKIFEERMTLTYEEDLPSPCSYKKIEIEGQSIRVSYIDFVQCEQYKQPYKYDLQSKTQERCLEYVTYTYLWDAPKKTYRLLYDETRIAPKGMVLVPQLLIQQPDILSLSALEVKENQTVTIIKQFEKYIQKGKKTTLENYFYVQLSSGKKGYLPATAVQLLDVESGDVLNTYYNSTPISKSDWKPDTPFLKIKERR